MLVAEERLALARPAEALRDELLAAGLVEFPLSGDLAITATRLDDLHPDPADRFLVATALATAATLVTADPRLLEWPGRLERQDARL